MDSCNEGTRHDCRIILPQTSTALSHSPNGGWFLNSNRTSHVLIKPDIFTCYEQESSHSTLLAIISLDSEWRWAESAV